MSYYQGKTAVVTGAASGLGRALVTQLAAEGAKVLMSDVDEAGLQETLDGIRSAGNDVADSRILDVADRDAVFAYGEAMTTEHGTIDVLINNAGIAGPNVTFADSSIDTYDKVLGVNVNGVINCTHAFLPALIRNPGSHLVNLSSIFGLVAPPETGAYVISKFAVRGYTEALISELSPKVKVTSVHPGVLATNIVKSSGADQKTQDFFEKGMPPVRAARILLQGVAKGKKRVLITKEARFLDILQRLLPTGYRSFLPEV